MDEILLKYRVCYADTDAAGVIYHGKYIEMAERSRTELVEKSLPADSLKAFVNIGFIVKKIITQYDSFGFLNDVLILKSSIIKMTQVRSWWLTEIKKDENIICNVFAEIIYYNRMLKCPQILDAKLVELFEKNNMILDNVDMKKYSRIISV